ncbi:MAG: cobyrinate a,c-diamide synthase [Mycobacterium sp.]
MSVPAVVVAAPASGSGKTTVATGLIGALRRAGHTVAPFKVGPDFIDPGYHGLAAGRPGRNLDPVLVGENLVGPLYAHGAGGADIAVIEGVMGLFDGRIGPAATGPAEGSTAHVAGLLGAPVILVVDARGQSHSIAALLHGFSTFDAATRVRGVILNRVGSARHEHVLRQACEQAGVAVLGAIPRTAELELPTRYLGLVTAVEYGRRARLAVEAMTDLVAAHVDLAAVAAVAACRAGPAWDPATAVGETPGGRATVAMAAGKAFSFAYAEHAELLQAAGAPIHAECAGLIYLATELDGYPMCGVLAASARFTPHLTLAYRDAVAVADSPLYSAGQRAVGHEFHRTAVTFSDSYQPAWVYRGNGADSERAAVRDGAVHAGVHGSYLHTHPAAAPAAVARFVAHAAAMRRRP